MATFTTRLPMDINNQLEKVSYQTGIPKSSLILYAINDCLRLRNDMEGVKLVGFSDDNLVRFTLRMPDNLKVKLEEVSQKNNTSINSLVLAYVVFFNDLYWKFYK